METAVPRNHVGAAPASARGSSWPRADSPRRRRPAVVSGDNDHDAGGSPMGDLVGDVSERFSPTCVHALLPTTMTEASCLSATEERIRRVVVGGVLTAQRSGWRLVQQPPQPQIPANQVTLRSRPCEARHRELGTDGSLRSRFASRARAVGANHDRAPRKLCQGRRLSGNDQDIAARLVRDGVRQRSQYPADAGHPLIAHDNHLCLLVIGHRDECERRIALVLWEVRFRGDPPALQPVGRRSHDLLGRNPRRPLMRLKGAWYADDVDGRSKCRPAHPPYPRPHWPWTNHLYRPRSDDSTWCLSSDQSGQIGDCAMV